MARVSISELKANLSRYLREVRRGGEVEILERGVPIARLVALEPGPSSQDERRERLIRSGVLRPGRGDASPILGEPPLQLNTSILDALEEERADRL
ncbi:MAG TPA: type II toxin-antitoxin system prevent-host-death family antitoxin [Thermoanaerobaculia bacterium]|nr:type II toxin-antitoxin system prevent-host-death family antitoxin [Thermoanaerobaculia bacterium]